MNAEKDTTMRINQPILTSAAVMAIGLASNLSAQPLPLPSANASGANPTSLLTGLGIYALIALARMFKR